MAKNTYWLTDGYGSKAFVEGNDERDRWVPHGWRETSEPEGDDRVWMQHTEHGGRAQFPAGVAEQWKALGWNPSPPPEPVDITKDPALVDVRDDKNDQRTNESRSTQRATSGTAKEN